MTRKHFEAMARHLKNSRPEFYDTFAVYLLGIGPRPRAAQCQSAIAQWNQDVLEMTDFCGNQNSNFNRERFLEACGCTLR